MRMLLLVLVLGNLVFCLWNALNYKHKVSLFDTEKIIKSDMPGLELTLVDVQLQIDSVSRNNSLGDVSKYINASCFVIGPVNNPETSKSLEDEINKAVLKYRVLNQGFESIVDYWVYLKPDISRDTAVMRLRELHEKKIDSYIIPEGELANGISLGVFDKKENAEKRQNEIRALGLDPFIKPNMKSNVDIWYLVEIDNLDQKTTDILDIYTKKQGLKTDHMKKECNKIESMK